MKRRIKRPAQPLPTQPYPFQFDLTMPAGTSDFVARQAIHDDDPLTNIYKRAEAMSDNYDALSDIYAMMGEPPAPALTNFTTVWNAGGWQISRGNDGPEAGRYTGHKLPGYKQLVGRNVVQIAANALTTYRPLSPLQILALPITGADDVIEDDYCLAGETLEDDLGFVVYPGQPYRRIVTSVAGCQLTSVYSLPAAVLWASGRRCAGELAAAVARVRAIELDVSEG